MTSRFGSRPPFMTRSRHPANRASPPRSTSAFFFFPSAATRRDSVGCDASPRSSGAVPARSLTPRRKAGSSRNTPASLWSRRHWAARSSAVRSNSVIVCRILRVSRASASLFAIHRTTPLRRSTSRPVTAPASPVIRSRRASIFSDRLNLSVHSIIFTLT